MSSSPDDLPDDAPDRSRGPGPYRAPPPLDALPYDWHRVKISLLVVVSLACGGMLHATLPELVNRAAPNLIVTEPERTLSTPRRLPPMTLAGPERTVTLPMHGPAVMHVWLQGCADCMPAFNAALALKDRGGLGVDVPVINVAFGSADPEWAARYGVDENLVMDPGGASVVSRLGISTFTTIVLDEQGYVRLTDRPDRAGYKDRVTGAVRALLSAPKSKPEPPPLPIPPPSRSVRSHPDLENPF